MRKPLVIFFIFFPFLVGCSSFSFRGGPSEQQIKQDVTSSIETCMQLAKNSNRAYALVDSVKIADTKVYNNEATVRVSIEYHWVGTPTPADTFPAPPCTYINPQSTKTSAQPTVTYKHSGSDWKFIEIR
jgi:hypothetical protein